MVRESETLYPFTNPHTIHARPPYSIRVWEDGSMSLVGSTLISVEYNIRLAKLCEHMPPKSSIEDKRDFLNTLLGD